MSVVLEVEARETYTNSSRRKLREGGRIPAIVYGSKIKSYPISVDSIELVKVIRDQGRNGVLDLSLNGTKHSVMVYDLQLDPLKNEIIHVDFCAVDMKSEIEVEVPVVLEGTSQGEKDGGVMQQVLHHLTVLAKPDDIPQSIDIDISNLHVNDTMHVEDLNNARSYKIVNDGEEVIISILPPRQELEISTGEEQEPGEPEVIEGRETKE
ncbi:50S ribosomal protein L25/general stress protein Ctc [Bacillus carboniphilus]|uniref:Large ribosomal subunit protein bL25 n=1 Tax=Bacillus carboniphilus TaxID=86663 RepID=A0ABY9JW75_9BACI|nr:50S ribosomal protein L25/general stress protein Ctc [Bacillus carboniphilus]WLR41926.1 50S ribosomal protein L25/general stress protein Ctc [Bacillus carboniphilus]